MVFAVGSLVRIVLDFFVVVEECLERRCALDGMKGLVPAGWSSFMAIWWTLDMGLAISDLMCGREADNYMIVLDVLYLLVSIPKIVGCVKFLKNQKNKVAR